MGRLHEWFFWEAKGSPAAGNLFINVSLKPRLTKYEYVGLARVPTDASSSAEVRDTTDTTLIVRKESSSLSFHLLLSLLQEATAPWGLQQLARLDGLEKESK